MGAPVSEVGYTSAITRRWGPQSLYGHVVALEKKIHLDLHLHKGKCKKLKILSHNVFQTAV
jgi:hypothetical protein